MAAVPKILLERPDDSSVREALERVLKSEPFARAQWSPLFLRFIVTTTLAGRKDEIKELIIAQEVFRKPHDFDTKDDGIVRKEARKLRNRLKGYYENDGVSDPIMITLEKGGYVPEFLWALNPAGDKGDSLATTPAREVATAAIDAGNSALTTLSGVLQEFLRAAAATPALESQRAESPTIRQMREALASGDCQRLTDFSADDALKNATQIELREAYTILTLGGQRAKKLGTSDTRQLIFQRERIAIRLLEVNPHDLGIRMLFLQTGLEAAQLCWNEQRWLDVIDKCEAVTAIVRQTFPDLLGVVLPSVRTFRFWALFGLKRFDDVLTEVSLATVQEDYPEQFYCTVLAMLLMVYAQARKTVEVQMLRLKFGNALEDQQTKQTDIDNGLRIVVAGAREMASASLWDEALAQIDWIIPILRQRMTPAARSLLAVSLYRGVEYSVKLDRLREALERHGRMEEECAVEDAELVQWPIAWAGVEATRALRSLKQYQVADALVASLNERFRNATEPETHRALAWANVELSKTAYGMKNYVEAAATCSRFIESHYASDMSAGLRWPVAWAYAQKVLSCRKAKLYDEAIAACDELAARFREIADDDIQFEIAWALIEKIVVLRHSKRLGASAALAHEVAKRFADSNDPRIVAEVAWTVHMEGDARLCEGKLMMQGGLSDDGHVKLEEAARLFAEAFKRDPEQTSHLKCLAYSRYLLGDLTAAKEAIKDATAIGPVQSWFEEEDWFEVSFFPLPGDDEFVDIMRSWVTEYHPLA
jgi:tetratricopeptide (TPR) repeat protein